MATEIKEVELEYGERPDCCGQHKHTPRSEELVRDADRRINRAIGQLNGVKAMLDDNRYCGDVLTQLAAAESAIKAVSRIILKEHLETCVVEVMDLLKKFGA